MINVSTTLGSVSSHVVFARLVFGYLIQLLGVWWKRYWGHKFSPCVSSLLSSILWPHSPLASCLENAWYWPPEDEKRYGGSAELHTSYKGTTQSTSIIGNWFFHRRACCFLWEFYKILQYYSFRNPVKKWARNRIRHHDGKGKKTALGDQGLNLIYATCG